MSTSRTPVGPLPPKVYWRRRIVVGLGLLAVIVAIVLIVIRPGQGGATPPSDPPASSPAPSQSAEPDAGETAEPDTDAEEEQPADGSPAACSAASVTLEAVMDKDNYAAGELPQLSLKVTNTGATPCVLEAGTDVQEYRITSGSDLIWSSSHCLQNPQPSEIVLKPEQSVSPTPFEWSRERSDPNTCDGERPAVIGGGATYVLQVFVGDLQSEQNRFVLL
ncbi:hypothetical protein ACFFGH_22250 [Lysobacter korlensis]|uniref:DUF4232 domain-containing protein n=1 Tax=Lysobacter korlensis TaxID=553636 RepID=A0ABV6RVW4_9GAMM